MIKRNSLLALFCAIIVFSITCPSVAYTTFPPDSIRIKWMEGKKFILHKVEPQETWQHLSRRYSCNIGDLKAANEGVEQLKIGQIINVPVVALSASAIPETKPSDNPVVTPVTTEKVKPSGNGTTSSTGSLQNPLFYKVKKGDTMFSISRKFNKSVEDLKSLNNLGSDGLKEGQVLTVGYTVTKRAPAADETASTSSVTPILTVQKPLVITSPEAKTITADKSDVKPVIETGVSPAAGYEKPTKSVSALKKGNTGKTLMQVTETGVATWIQEGQINPGKYYALHRSAPIGTIVKLTNRMNNQFVYVKVVGSLPDTGENENIVIKVSQAVSSKLNALDPLFQVEMSYGMLN